MLYVLISKIPEIKSLNLSGFAAWFENRHMPNRLSSPNFFASFYWSFDIEGLI
jgi:hypothetical protein